MLQNNGEAFIFFGSAFSIARNCKYHTGLVVADIFRKVPFLSRKFSVKQCRNYRNTPPGKDEVPLCIIKWSTY
jgi:hypothetical protein